MTTSSSTRIESAFQRLLESIVEDHVPGESDDQAQQRWDRIQERVRSVIATPRDASSSADATAISDLIRQDLLTGPQGRGTAGRQELERATKFSNLYSRLLAQPVLSQKRGILLFLWKMAHTTEHEAKHNGVNGNRAHHGSAQISGRQSRAAAGMLDDAATLSRIYDSTLLPDQLTRNDHAKTRDTTSHDPKPDEPTMLRDLTYTFQGLSSKSFPYANESSIKIPPHLPVPLVSILHLLSEPALLYKQLSTFANSTNHQGLIEQSLRSAIGAELRGYLALVAQIEGHIRTSLQQDQDTQLKPDTAKSGVTLKRLLIWTKDATQGLRFMSLLTERKGKDLISRVHHFSTSYGDEFVLNFANKLLEEISKPLYAMVQAWIYEGELHDPYKEFFVTSNEDNDNDASSAWYTRFTFRPDMVPSIMTEAQAKQVFLIGKSLNFIRYSCEEGAWVEDFSRTNARTFTYSGSTELSAAISSAYDTATAHLLHLMENKFSLSLHLNAFKKYLLLGQGDFIATLMESLSSNLDRPANSQYRHTLTGKLESAISSSNAKHDDPEVLRRLDSRMLELSHGEIGWDVFTLDYRVDAPLDVIVTEHASKQYLKMFNFLWRVKRVEYALSSIWRRCMTGARGILAELDDTLSWEWRLTRASLAEMVHFINQLQRYLLFDVIEGSFERFQTKTEGPKITLDGLIEAHELFLKDVTRKGLVGGADFLGHLHGLLKLMIIYRDTVEGLYSFCISNPDVNDSTFENLSTRLQSLRADHKSKVCILLGELRHHTDGDLRRLGSALNFNNAYVPVRRRV